MKVDENSELFQRHIPGPPPTPEDEEEDEAASEESSMVMGDQVSLTPTNQLAGEELQLPATSSEQPPALLQPLSAPSEQPTSSSNPPEKVLGDKEKV